MPVGLRLVVRRRKQQYEALRDPLGHPRAWSGQRYPLSGAEDSDIRLAGGLGAAQIFVSLPLRTRYHASSRSDIFQLS